MPRKANTAAEENVTASENTQELTEIMQEDPIQKTNLETEIDISEETEKAGGIEDEADVDEVAEPDYRQLLREKSVVVENITDLSGEEQVPLGADCEKTHCKQQSSEVFVLH